MAKVLVFTIVEKQGYKSSFIKNGKLIPWVKDSIQKEYGIKKRELNHESIYASEANNGDELYIEIVSEKDDWQQLSRVSKSIREAKVRKGRDLHEWVKTSGFKLIKTETYISMMTLDEYLLEVE